MTGDPTAYFQCIEACTAMLRQDPTNADLRRLCARSHSQLGTMCEDDTEAAEYFRKALELDAEMADAHCNLGLRIRDRDVPGAERHFRKAVQFAAALQDSLASGSRNAGAAGDQDHEPQQNQNHNEEGDDDDDEEEEEEEEDEDDISSADQEELVAGRVAQYNLALLLAQIGDHDAEADAHCRALNFNFRLSSEVLAHAFHRANRRTQASKQVPESQDPQQNAHIAVHDNAVRPALLRQLQENFAPESPFWDEHGYRQEPGFFSYNYKLDQPPSNIVEVLIQSLRPILEADLKVGQLVSALLSHCTPPPSTSLAFNGCVHACSKG